MNVPLIQNSEKKKNIQFDEYENKRKRYIRAQKEPFFTWCFFSIFPSYRKQDLISQRAIFPSRPRYNPHYFSNKESNMKYNFISFIPFVILNQFRFFGNQFYLLMTISQFIPFLKVGFLFSYLSPLIIVIIISLIKELIDEIKRYNQDKQTNSEKYMKIEYDRDSNKIKNKVVFAKDIKVGDVIQLTKDKRAPADMIIIKTIEQGPIFIRTDQLDGETDLKSKKCPLIFQNVSDDFIFRKKLMIEYVPTSKDIYNFRGTIYQKKSNEVKKELLGYENTIWGNTILASNKIWGLVIYTGKDMRSKMNASLPKFKVGALDMEINLFNKLLFTVMVLLALVISFYKKSTSYYYIIVFFRFIVLLCGIIPISLRVNLDISKGYFSYLIGKDEEIKGTIVRNSSIPEDLGRISYIFTDKTGTLTKNEMHFKSLTTIDKRYFAERDFEFIQTCVKQKHKGVYINNSIKAMALCNNVIPIKDKQNKTTYQASSPDELSLVEFAERAGMRINERDDFTISLITENNGEEIFDILENFPFTSERKRMGIVLQSKTTGEIVFYLKGAENVLTPLVESERKTFINETATQLAKQGLRILVLSHKTLTKDFYDQWKQNYNKAEIDNSKEEKDECLLQLEQDVKFLCITAVEDALQDNIVDTFKSLRQAGIKIWMLTGDKAETAECISITTGLQSKSQKVFPILKEKDDNDYEAFKKKIYNKLTNFGKDYLLTQVLLIESDVINVCLKDLRDKFFTIAMKSPSVICCRCSPTQKSEIVQGIKNYTSARTIAIGDGGNDVSMIQQADIGIGIEGKEGKQASLASDYSLVKFCYVKKLLLWWGRLTYKNTGTMSNFIIHRGLIISFIQCIFSALFYFNPVALYNGWLIFGYGTIYTNFPAISVLLDRDSIESTVLKHPELYRESVKGRELSLKHFLQWTFKGLFQAGVIMFGSVMIFEDNIYLKIVTVTFTELIFAELLNVYLEIKKYNIKIYCVLIATCALYFSSLWFLDWLLDVYYIFDFSTLMKIIIIVAISWIPIFVSNKIISLCNPELIKKIN